MTSNNDDNVNLEKLNISDEIINDYDNGSQEQKEKEKDVELDNPDLEEEVGITMNDDEGDHKLNNQKIDDEINKEDEKDVKASDDDHDDDDDDDFDDFNEASFQQAPTIGSTNQENGHDDNDDDDDDEFGDFDDFQVSQPSPTQQQQQKQQSQTQSQSISIDKVNFPTTIFNSPKEFSQRLTTTLDEIFPTSTPILEDNNNNNNKNQITTSIQLLNERSQEIYKQLSTLPYLQPTNWIKLNIRHNLLIKLGIPINLDELNDTNTISANPNNKNIVTSETQNDLKIPGYNFSSGGGSGSGGGGFVSVSGRQRKSSISINDINWNELNLISEIPKFESLNIDDNLKNSLINSTLDKLNQFELDNLYHNLTTTTTTTTISVTTAAEGDGSNNNNKSNSSSNDSGSTIGGGHANSQWIDEKLNKLTSNYNELLTLSSIWINQIDQLHEEFEIYENVIQSFIGYNQKLRREEIFENLKKLKKKKKKGKATK